MAGYLVVFTEDNAVQAGLYDESLQFISDIDLNSDEAVAHLGKGEELGNLESDMWDPILGDLSLQQRREARAYRLNEDIVNERDAEIEEAMQENDDELPYGYNG
jgi:hypothetical protein